MDKFTPDSWKTFLAICDGLVPAVDPKVIEPYVKSHLSQEEMEQLANTTPSSLPAFQTTLDRSLKSVSTAKVADLAKVMKLLGRRSVAILLTGSTKLLTEMNAEEKGKVLLSWRDSRFLAQLFRALLDLTVVTFIRANPLCYKAVGHPEYYEHYDQIDHDSHYQYNLLNFDGLDAKAVEIETDVVIVGSGSGAGVVASRLAKEGHRVLVLEKGGYYPQSKLKFNEDQAVQNLYENGALLTTEDGSMTILAGSTLGGGSTVNWSASLKTPPEVRQQWAKSVPWYNQKVYDDAMEYVLKKMGCSTENMTHSYANQTILDGCAKLGYEVKEVPQNTNGQHHKCGTFCANGCAEGVKQGGVVNWLKDAAEHGAKIVEKCSVLRINHENGVASSVDAVINIGSNDAVQFIVHAKRVVVSCGSLQTPGLLHRSQFKNSKIGRGLKLHPATSVSGEFEHDLHGYRDPILTTVCSQFANLDSKHHGPRIETQSQQPFIESKFHPWTGGEGARENLVRYNRIAMLLVIVRDRGCGKVTFTKDRPLLPRIDYTPSEFDCHALLQGCLPAADILYIQGAIRILVPVNTVAPFESFKPASDRAINDPDYVAWRKQLQQATIKPVASGIGSAHQMASCRMSGNGPSKAPVNARGQLYECKNVYVADASVLPSASGVNPMISTMSTAHVIAGFINDELKATLPSRAHL